MSEILNSFIEKLEKFSSSSKFKVRTGLSGGYISFSNSGQRGEVKYFTLGLSSLLSTLKDIKTNVANFKNRYDETPWRNSFSSYLTDDDARAMSTVQTKPLFCTLSKVINWANDIVSNNDEEINLSNVFLDKTIEKLSEIIRIFTVSANNTVLNNVVTTVSHEPFTINKFPKDLMNANIKFPPSLPIRFVSALLTKPFLILTGLAGSGKTKLAEAFAYWITEDNAKQICMVAVGADWTNREPLLGYPNALETGKYVKPDNGVLDLIINAKSNTELPYFLILDEMNMSHVERYFADFLSAMESDSRQISLHPNTSIWKDSEDNWNDDIPDKIELPKNLFIIGTVNIDETTYMFSPKVLDRAQVIEFRVSQDEMKNYLNNPLPINMDQLKHKGSAMGADFVTKAQVKRTAPEKLTEILLPFFEQLQSAGAEFGYRTASDISAFIATCTELTNADILSNEIVDAAIMQKLLPKLHGSRNKIAKNLLILGRLCLEKSDEKTNPFDDKQTGNIKYKLSHEKLTRMHNRVISDGFTSYAEA